MSNRGDSRWRWTLLVAMVALLVGRLAASCCWVSLSLIPGAGGPPVVLVHSSLWRETLETWDWRTNETETIAVLEGDPVAYNRIVATEDGKIVWFGKGTLYVIDVKSPHERRAWKTPFPNDQAHWFTVLGTSANSRFIALQYVRVDKTTRVQQFESADLAVIDLQAGEVVSNRNWHSTTEATLIVGEFVSRRVMLPGGDPDEPAQAYWRLTDQGAWELLPAAKEIAYNHIQIVKDPLGNLRQLLDGDTQSVGEAYESQRAYVVSPGGEHVLMRQEGTQLLLAHDGDRDVQKLPVATYYHTPRGACFTADGKHFLVRDAFGDVHVFDAATGQLLASTKSAWTSFCVAAAFSAAWLVVALGWLWLAFQLNESLWTIVDLHAAGIAGQIAQLGFSESLRAILPVSLMFVSDGSLLAVTAAFGLAIGWYWTYGWASTGVKFKWSSLSILAVATTPAIVSAMYGYPDFVVPRLIIPSFATLFAASVPALMLVPFSLFPWRASDQPLPSQSRQFGLASMMLLIAGIAVVLGFLNLVMMESSREAAADAALFLLPVAVLGLVWPALAMMNIGRGSRIALGTGVAVLVVGTMALCTSQRDESRWQVDQAAYGFTAATSPLILVMAILARKHGWRWRKAQASTSVLPSSEAAA